jgi:hypothetical protein
LQKTVLPLFLKNSKKGGVYVQIHVHGVPSFDHLAKWQKEALVNPLLEVIKDFYAKEENRQAYEKWKLKRKEIEANTLKS